MNDLFKMTSKTYDNLKWIAQYLLPALGTLYFALAGIWNFPYAEQVVGTITALDTFLGVILGISNAKYVEENSDTGIAEEAKAEDVEEGAEG
jgi:hypothetical protein